MEARSQWDDIFKVQEESKKLSTNNSISVRLSFKNKEKLRHFPDKPEGVFY